MWVDARPSTKYSDKKVCLKFSENPCTNFNHIPPFTSPTQEEVTDLTKDVTTLLHVKWVNVSDFLRGVIFGGALSLHFFSGGTRSARFAFCFPEKE